MTYTRSIDSEQQNKTCFILKQKQFLTRIFRHIFVLLLFSCSRPDPTRRDLQNSWPEQTRGRTRPVDISGTYNTWHLEAFLLRHHPVEVTSQKWSIRDRPGRDFSVTECRCRPRSVAGFLAVRACEEPSTDQCRAHRLMRSDCLHHDTHTHPCNIYTVPPLCRPVVRS